MLQINKVFNAEKLTEELDAWEASSLTQIVQRVLYHNSDFSVSWVQFDDTQHSAQEVIEISAIINNHDNTVLTTEQQQESFVDAMRPIIQDWHQGIQTTAQALVSANAVLDAHPSHKTVMNTVRWQNARLIVNPLANVTLGNISGNANAEAAYLNELFIYVTQVKAWRN